jgi:hypothetical protein
MDFEADDRCAMRQRSLRRLSAEKQIGENVRPANDSADVMIGVHNKWAI